VKKGDEHVHCLLPFSCSLAKLIHRLFPEIFVFCLSRKLRTGGHMAQESRNFAFRAAELPRWFFIMRPEAAMHHASMPRPTRELNIWRMAAALRVDMAAAIQSGALTRDAPLDLLVSMTRRCAACDHAETCRQLLRTAADGLHAAPDYCRVKNRLAALAPTRRGRLRADRAS
jgi:hypothetical protein